MEDKDFEAYVKMFRDLISIREAKENLEKVSAQLAEEIAALKKLNEFLEKKND